MMRAGMAAWKPNLLQRHGTETGTEWVRARQPWIAELLLVPRTMASACRHPRVRVVSRHDDTEFVECLDCGEIFDSEEFRDMEIEDTAETKDLEDES